MIIEIEKRVMRSMVGCRICGNLLDDLDLDDDLCDECKILTVKEEECCEPKIIN